MKTRMTILIATFFIVISCTGQKEEKHLSELDLKGKVKSVVETNGGQKFRYILFNEAGNITEYTCYRYDGTIKYDYSYKCVYDQNGNEIERDYYRDANSFGDKIIWKYDLNGNNIEVAEYWYDGSLKNKQQSIYDSTGNEIEYKYYNDDSLLFTFQYKYDVMGNKIEMGAYNPDGGKQYNTSNFWIHTSHTYKYDLGGNMTEDKFVNNDDRYEIRKYDSFGNIIEVKYYNSDGSLSLIRVSKFDTKGNEIEWSNYNPGGDISSTYTVTYIYDIYDNWTNKTEYENSVYISMNEREIIYY